MDASSKQHTNSETGEPGNKEHSHIGSSRTHKKKRKTESEPRVLNKIKIQCACDGCNTMISAKLAALKKHHKVHHNAILSLKVLRKLYKGKFIEN